MKNNVLEKVKEPLKNDLIEKDGIDFEALKLQATMFLDKINQISMVYQSGLANKSIKKKINTLYTAMKQHNVSTPELLRLAHQFEMAVNSFLGRTIYLTYVKDDGTLLFYDDVRIGKLYEQATANRGRGNIGKEKIVDANDLEQDLKQRIEQANQKRFLVYQKAVERWTSSKTNMNYNPKEKTYYWKIMNSHKIGYTNKIGSKGIIAEGYTGAVINEDPYVSNANIETGLWQLWKNHIQKDSTPALVKGDIVLGDNNRIQFAVKEGSFSTAMLGQYINLAINIKNLNKVTPQELEANLSKLVRLSKVADSIVENLNKEAEKSVEEEILKLGIRIV